MADHVHMLISIPSKYAVSQVIGYIKGKSAIHIARVYGERKRNFVSTMGRDEALIRDYIRYQNHEDKRWSRWNCCANDRL
jgi:putative transposase